jgi:hypothetical protein
MAKIKNDLKLYSYEYLMNEELTENDLHLLLDTKSMFYSLIIGMYSLIGKKYTKQDIHNLYGPDNKFDKMRITMNQYHKIINSLTSIYKNIYQYGNLTALSEAQNFYTYYCPKVKNFKI